ncbi:MAG: GNAT family N-acetyltransferase [Gaiellaceae bacterium MAG52_C11]|nr:GNAT family N-acetyltransferase [Candidatus Gaiellasilicea maunaloa]
MSTIRPEPLSAAHLEGVRALVADPEVLRFTRVPEPVPAGFPERWLDRYEEGRRDGSREAYAIEDASTTEFLGLALVPTIDRDGRTAELGYLVAPAARGRGVASEALRLLSDWAISELDAQRLELMISVENAASKRVAERCGYEREGVLRSIHLKEGVREDMEIWSRLAVDG